MEENQNNLNQNPAQQEQQQAVQQAQQGQQNVQNQVSVSMEIQELLVQQQQYQQQYNQLVEYVKNTPNLPIEQVNQIKQQLDQLNALFVQGKQKLQALGYNTVQVNKPTEVKKGSQNNLSFKKIAIGCGIVLVLILAGFFITLFSLKNNPKALLGLGISAATAKALLQGFCALIFGSFIFLMLGVIISNIYRLITVKNQSKKKYILGLIGGLLGAGVVGAAMGFIMGEINKIQTEDAQPSSYLIQPYLMGLFNDSGKRSSFRYDSSDESYNYPLIAPAEFGFTAIGSDILKNLGSNKEIESVVLICGNKQGQKLEISPQNLSIIKNGGDANFDGTCLYGEKGAYTYSLEVMFTNNITNEKNQKKTMNVDKSKSLKFVSEISISLTTSTSTSANNKTSRIYPTNGEFLLGKAPAQITVDATQVFRDFSLKEYNVLWDLDGNKTTDGERVSFDYSYKLPQVYYPSVKFPDLKAKYGAVSGFEFIYTFPVRVEQSDKPVCGIEVSRFPGTTKFQVSTDFVDASSAATISKYKYTIQNSATKKALEVLDDYPQEFNYEFPEKGDYVVILDYVTVDGKQGQCQSSLIQLEKETFNVQYIILGEDPETGKYKEVCNSKGTEYSNCKQISLSTVPQKYQLQIKSITPSSNTLKKVVYLDDATLLNEDDIYSFAIPDEGTYVVKIVTSDVSRGMEEETLEIKFIAKKPNIIGNMTVISNDTRKPISEGFEPLTVILDASKTEINVPGDEIVYFTRDFGDGEIKRNQQNGVVAHTYNFDYIKENGIFQPKVTITTKEGLTDTILGPKINVKKGLINVELSSVSHPSRQAAVGKDVTFSAEFDGLPETMVWDFGDGTPNITCPGRTCTEVMHAFKDTGLFSVKLSLEFDAVQQVDGTMDFKVY